MSVRLSTWKLIDYGTCGRMYQLKYEGGGSGWSFPPEKQEDFAYGKVIHAVIQEGIVSGSAYEDACKSLWAKINVDLSNLQETRRQFLYYQGAYWLQKLWHRLPENKFVKGFEKHFTVDVGDVGGKHYYVTGRYDMLLQKDNSYLIGDIKTRSKLYEEKGVAWDSQLGIYAWSFWKANKVIPYVRFYELGKSPDDNPKNIEVRIATAKPSEATISDIENTISEAIQGIENKCFSKKSGFHCSWCGFNSECFDLSNVTIENL